MMASPRVSLRSYLPRPLSIFFADHAANAPAPSVASEEDPLDIFYFDEAPSLDLDLEPLCLAEEFEDSFSLSSVSSLTASDVSSCSTPLSLSPVPQSAARFYKIEKSHGVYIFCGSSRRLSEYEAFNPFAEV